MTFFVYTKYNSCIYKEYDCISPVYTQYRTYILRVHAYSEYILHTVYPA